jgi:ribosomal protein S18 acetylase RimI-like enzyme
MRIADLTSADVANAAELWRESGLVRPWNPPEQDIERALSGATSTVLGGFDDGALVATVMVGHDGHRGWLYYLAVADGSRGTGRGKLMLDAAEQWLRERDVVKVQLMVRSGNEQVLGFYEHLGYEDADVQVRSKWLV